MHKSWTVFHLDIVSIGCYMVGTLYSTPYQEGEVNNILIMIGVAGGFVRGSW